MKVPFFFKFFLAAVAASLMIFAFAEYSLMALLKMLALSTALSIIVALLYPSFRGLKKGDKILLSTNNIPAFLGIGRTGYAIEDGKLNTQIKIKLSDGREAVGIVESYGGTFEMPKVRLLYEESIKE